MSALQPLQYIDTHAHLNLAQFADDAATVFASCAEQGVGMINVGTRKDTSALAVALANQHEHAWAIVGIHPLNVLTADPDDHGAAPEGELDDEFYRPLAVDPRTVGIGECGFDYFHNPDSTYPEQRRVFEAQIALANEVKKPLMLHLRNTPDGSGRNAYDDALEILRSTAQVPGNAHFFAGTIEQLQAFLDLGFTVSFTGVITFAKPYRELVAYAPLERLHAETDCPYVAPVPYRGQRAEPWMVKSVVATIATYKGLAEETVQAQLLCNAQRLYALC
ncbi:MAG: TatD family hydrolase [Patescibacteria group bacterium]